MVEAKTKPKASGDGPSLYVVGMSLGLTFAITFVVCVVWCLLFPDFEMQPAWAMFFPWFEWISWPSFFIGLVEAFIYGWYFAVVFVPIYTCFKNRT